MLPADYLTSLPLAERLYRQQPDLAGRIYSGPVLDFLRDGVVIFPQALDPELLDRMDGDLEALPGLARTSLLHGMIGIDGKAEHYDARVLRNLPRLGITDLRTAPPGLKLNDLHRYFEAARSLAFADPIIHFLDELFGSSPGLIQSLTFWKSSEQSLHQDFSYVHHHSRLGHLAAAWIPWRTSAIRPDRSSITRAPICWRTISSTTGAGVGSWPVATATPTRRRVTARTWRP